MTFDWNYARSIFPALAEGAKITLWATLLGMLVACVLGLVLCIGGYVPSKTIRFSAKWIGEFLRNTPLLIQVFALYYMLPEIGIRLPALQTGVAALGLQYAGYVSETYRAGIESLPRGQWEACRALNMSEVHTWRAIIIPQAVRRVIPALGTFMIGMFKDSPLLFTIGVAELLSHAMTEGGNTYQYTEPILMVGAFFLIMSLASALILSRLNRRLSRAPS